MEDTNEFADAQQAEALRQKIRTYAGGAIKYNKVDRNWVNQRLNQMGAQLVTSNARYQINVPITGSYGATIVASTRADAMDQFKQRIAKVASAGHVVGSSHGVYNVEFTGDEPQFHSGPEDIELGEAGPVPGLDGLKNAIRDMLMVGVAEQGWNHDYAVRAATDMGLESLPTLSMHTVKVPVSGTAVLSVRAFGDDPDAVQRATAGLLARTQQIAVQPDEIGNVSVVIGTDGAEAYDDSDGGPF